MIVKIYNFIIPLIFNNFLKILKLKKRNKNAWIFGAWGGDSYSDNSKYLFEYVIEYLPHINAVWITKKPEIKEKLTLARKKCYLHNEPNGRKARLNAKYVFFTNGMTDFGKYDLCHGATKVALWHGMPLKRLQYATSNSKKRKRNIFRLIQYMVSKTYNYSQRDITIATSETTKKLFVECFEVKPETVIITGQPRNDVLFDNKKTILLKQKLNHPPNKKFILYMPTWRSFKSHERFLDSIVQELKSDSSFNAELQSKNITLYIKPHPRIKIGATGNSQIVVLDSVSDIDPQQLLAAADVLITDYSSVFIDYALLERPVHFFVPDLEDYILSNNGLFFSFPEFAHFWFKKINDLKSSIINTPKFVDLGLKNSRKVNLVFNDMKSVKGQYCKKFIQTMQYKKL